MRSFEEKRVEELTLFPPLKTEERQDSVHYVCKKAMKSRQRRQTSAVKHFVLRQNFLPVKTEWWFAFEWWHAGSKNAVCWLLLLKLDKFGTFCRNAVCCDHNRRQKNLAHLEIIQPLWPSSL